MTTFVVLLRGVNVGGGNRVPMAALRERLEADGFPSVQTYIQSGNIVITGTRVSKPKVADAVRTALQEEFSVDVPVVVVTAAELKQVVDQNPYPDPPEPKFLHAMFLYEPLPPESTAHLDELVAQQAAKGSRDTITVVGSVLYLSTPDGFGTSELAKSLTTKGRHAVPGTARNWTTVTTLLRMASD